MSYGYSSGGGRGLNLRAGRLLVALVIAGCSVLSYYSLRVKNPVTHEVQHIDLSVDQEIALGLQAAPEMAAQHGGLSRDTAARQRVERIGQRIVDRSAAGSSEYRFQFHLLADPHTVNAFALPGGQVFLTEGLLRRLDTDGQVAGVLGHEIGHVIGRHGAEHLAQQRLTQGLAGAAVIASYDPDNPGRTRASAAMAMAVGQLVNLKYGRDDELESDRLGVAFMAEAGYDPRSLLRVMEVLAEASQGRAPPEFFSTHPNPENRKGRIEQAIDAKFPDGVPDGLEP